MVDVLARPSGSGSLRLDGAADSRLARGLVALLVQGLRGERAETLLALDPAQVARAAGLVGALSPSRVNGLGAMIRLMQRQLEAGVAAEAAADATPAGVASAKAAAEAAPADGASATTSGGEGGREAVLRAGSRGSLESAGEEVAVLLSGGVDSSVALRLLHDAGVRTRAFYLRIWLEDEDAHVASGECPWEEDWAYCTAVCEQAANSPLSSHRYCPPTPLPARDPRACPVAGGRAARARLAAARVLIPRGCRLSERSLA